MGVGLAIAGVAVAAGASAYSASQAGSNVPHANPVQFQQLSLPNITQGYATNLGNQAGAANDEWQRLLNKSVPTLGASGAAAGQIVQNNLNGTLSAQTQGNVARSSAYQSLQGGFGANSGSGQALTARDLGQTTQSLQNQGLAQMPVVEQYANFMNPTSVASMLGRQDSVAMYNNQVQNSQTAFNTNLSLQNQNAAYNAQMQQAGLISQSANQFALGGMGVANNYNNGMYGGSSGGGGGSVGPYQNLSTDGGDGRP